MRRWQWLLYNIDHQWYNISTEQWLTLNDEYCITSLQKLTVVAINNTTSIWFHLESVNYIEKNFDGSIIIDLIHNKQCMNIKLNWVDTQNNLLIEQIYPIASPPRRYKTASLFICTIIELYPPPDAAMELISPHCFHNIILTLRH